MNMNNYANILEFQTWIVYQRVAIDCAGCLCKYIYLYLCMYLCTDYKFSRIRRFLAFIYYNNNYYQIEQYALEISLQYG